MRLYYLLASISLFVNLSHNLPDICKMSYDEFIGRFKLPFLKRYIPKRELGTGGCGKVLEAIDKVRQQRVAIKFELKNCQPSPTFDTFENEVQVYEKIKGGEGIPKMFWHGSIQDRTPNRRNWHVLVLEKLGRSFAVIFHQCQNAFSTWEVVNLAMQMIKRIEYLHKKKYIHRDIKPANFLEGIGPTRKMVYLADFGSSQRYDPSRPLDHNLGFVGTITYAPISAHLGISQSPKDDLESLGYVLMKWMMNGRLPWDIYRGWVKKSFLTFLRLRSEAAAFYISLFCR